MVIKEPHNDEVPRVQVKEKAKTQNLPAQQVKTNEQKPKVTVDELKSVNKPVKKVKPTKPGNVQIQSPLEVQSKLPEKPKKFVNSDN